MLTKASTCAGCSLAERSTGYVPAIGPTDAPVLFVGEAAGPDEARQGEPFVGAAGSMLNRLLARSHFDRRAYRIDNVCRCQPPKMWFDERAPWYWSARQHCTSAHLSQTLAEPHKVIVALGSVAAKYLLDMDRGYRAEDHHGCVHETRHGLIVPTYHPSHLQRGAHNLFGVVSYDLQVAHRVAREGFTQEQPSIIVDPPLDWFTFWVDQVTQAAKFDPESVWLTVDIETPDKSDGQDEGELSSEDRSYTILRVNFSVHPDEGITVPYAGPYVALIDRLLQLPILTGWNIEYDRPRLEAAGHRIPGDWLDGMWLAHYLQSDIPRGLGFWAPFYSYFGAWKHLAKSQPGVYAACDGFQNWRIVDGTARDLQASGQWDTALRHVHRLHKVALKPAQQVGLLVSRSRLDLFIADLEVKQRRILHDLQGLVPEEVRPLTPKQGYKKEPPDGRQHAKGTSLKRDGTAKKEAPDPVKQDLYAQTAVLVQRTTRALVLVCDRCGAVEVQKRHACEAGADLRSTELDVQRWYWQEPFNPDSPDQILAYLAYRGHKPGKAKRTGADSTDHESLTRLARETSDPLYKAILDNRAVSKIKGTYGVGTRKLLDAEDRVHSTPTFKPSTGRLSYTAPNLTNVVSDREGASTLATGFRSCILPSPDCRLLEVDFAGIEAVLTGWFCRDLRYMKLATLGVHAAVTSHILHRAKKITEPYDHHWLGVRSDADLSALFKDLKKRFPGDYRRAKVVTHGTSYGLTPYGMVQNFGETFPTLKLATEVQRIYFEMAPGVPKWQASTRERAYQQNFLGGVGDHPYGYKHWFFSVLGFRAIPEHVYRKRQRLHEPCSTIQGKYFAVVLGEDAKRCVAFYPQSTAAGVLKEAMLRLFEPDSPSYIGDAYHGRTPLRAPIHDSLFLEVPVRQWDRVLEAVCTEMQRAIPELPLAWGDAAERQHLGLGEYLSIGVEAKAGADWGAMETISVPDGVSYDQVRFALDADEDNEADFEALGRVVA